MSAPTLRNLDRPADSEKGGVAAVNRRRRKKGQGLAAAGFLAPGMLGFLAFTIIPIVASLIMAFTMWPLVGEPVFTGFKNFAKLLTNDPVFRKATFNTFVYVIIYVPVNIVLSMAIAAWITPKIKGRNIYRILLFIPVVTPGVAVAVVFQLLLTPGGIVDGFWQSISGTHAPNFLGSSTWAMPSVIVMSLWMGLGYNLLIFSAGLDSIPDSLMDAADIDGAGTVRRFFKIKLPLLSPSIFFATVMTLITAMQVFIQPYILTGGGPNNSTSTMVMYLYRTGFQFYNLGYASAVAWSLFAIILLVTGLQFLGQRKWVHYDQ